MLKSSAKHISLPGIIPGMLVGIVIGLLLAGGSISGSGKQSNALPALSPDIDRLSFDQITKLPKSSLSCLCDDVSIAARNASATDEYVKQRSLSAETAISAGVSNTRRLLVLTKRLSIQALLEWAKHNGFPAQKLSRELQKIQRVNRIILDERLGYAAAVRDDRPREIRIGSGYAEALVLDDEAVFLLAHELTHVAAQSGGLDGLIETTARTAKVSAAVEVRDDQAEDLACDFIGTQVLKHFIDLYPTSESKAQRLLRTCGYESPSERLTRALEDFCASYNGFTGDTQHLSQALTIRALAGLDPELKAFLTALPATAASDKPDH